MDAKTTPRCANYVMLTIWIAVLCGMIPESSAQRCSRPPSPPSGVRWRAPNNRILTSYESGTIVQVLCTSSNDVLVGNNTITCLSSGSWSAYPECIQGSTPTTRPTAGSVGGAAASAGIAIGCIFGILIIVTLTLGCGFTCRKYCPGGGQLRCVPCPPVCIAYGSNSEVFAEYSLCPCFEKESTHELNVESPTQSRPVGATGTTPSPDSATDGRNTSTSTSSTHANTASSQPRINAQQRPVIVTEYAAVIHQTNVATSFTVDLNGDTIPGFAFGGPSASRGNGNRHSEDQPLRWHVTNSPPRSPSRSRTLHFEPAGQNEGEEQSIPKDSVLSKEPAPPSYGFVVENDVNYPAADKDLPPPYTCTP